MEDRKKTKEQLIQELEGLRKQVAELQEWKPSAALATDPVPMESLNVQTVGSNLQSGMIYQVIRENDGLRRFSYLSDTVRRFYGITPEQGVSDSNLIYGRVHEEDRARVFQEEEEANRTLSPFKTVIRIIDPSGAIRWSLLMSHPKRLADGSTCWDGIELDITDRKNAEEALKFSEERFRLFMDYSPTIAWVKDVQGRYVYISKTYERRYGVPTADWYGKTDQEIWPPETADLFQKKDKQVWETGAPIEVIEKIESPNGDQQFWLITKFPFQDAFGNRYVAGIGLDITERRRVEDALRQSEKRHRIIIQTAMDGFCMLNMDGRFLEVNKAFCRMCGYGERELLTMDIAAVDASETRPDVINRIQLLKVQGETRYETKHRRKDGRLMDVEVSVKYRPTEGGRFEVFLRDITDRKKKEKEIRKSQDRLRALSARLQTIREEERATIAREIHDDLGQLLTGLKMDLSWFLRHPHPDPTNLQERIQAINQLVDQTVQTVRRISTELRPLILDDFGLVAALEWQADEFAKKAGIPCFFHSTLQQLDLDPERSVAVFRIFQEALTNVARHAGATKVEVSLTKNTRVLILTIQDNGRGISKDGVANHRSLGLLGMRERALIFGGTIEIKGKIGKGTKIVLSLPVTG